MLMLTEVADSDVLTALVLVSNKQTRGVQFGQHVLDMRAQNRIVERKSEGADNAWIVDTSAVVVRKAPQRDEE